MRMNSDTSGSSFSGVCSSTGSDAAWKDNAIDGERVGERPADGCLLSSSGLLFRTLGQWLTPVYSLSQHARHAGRIAVARLDFPPCLFMISAYLVVWLACVPLSSVRLLRDLPLLPDPLVAHPAGVVAPLLCTRKPVKPRLLLGSWVLLRRIPFGQAFGFYLGRLLDAPSGDATGRP